jgi:hypothetical protein
MRKIRQDWGQGPEWVAQAAPVLGWPELHKKWAGVAAYRPLILHSLPAIPLRRSPVTLSEVVSESENKARLTCQIEA